MTTSYRFKTMADQSDVTITTRHRGCYSMIYAIFMLSMLSACAYDDRCSFSGDTNEANCDVMVASVYPVSVRATINQCSKPIDVTIRIQRINASWSWSHTFANRDEIQRLPGLGTDALLQVALKATHQGRLHVFAGFDISSRPGQVVIDQTVAVHGLDECVRDDNPNAYLPLVVFIILLILITALMATIVGFRRHRHHHNKRQSELLSNMEPSSMSSYRDDPTFTTSHHPPHHHATSQLIKNDIYRDTVTTITDAADTGQRAPHYNNHHSDATSGNGASANSQNGGELHIRPPPSSGSGGGRRGKRGGLLKNGLPQPVLERLPEEPGEDDCSSRELDVGINPSVTVTT